MPGIERSRPPVPEIPGVQKGTGSFENGQIRPSRIRDLGEEWGEKRLKRALFREKAPHQGRTILVVSKETLEGPLQLPKLATPDLRLGSLRYHPTTGSIYVPFWREIPVQVEDGRRFLFEAGNWEQIIKGRERRVDLENLPERPISKLEMKCCPDIGTAIRQAGHIIGKRMLTEEVEQLDLIWKQINQSWGTILSRKITESDLAVLAESTAEILVKARLAWAKKQAKVNIFNRLAKVFEKEDLTMTSSFIQQIRLRSAYLNAISLEAFRVLVTEKFSAIGGILLIEREGTRQSISSAIQTLDTLMGFSKRGAYVFEGGKLRAKEMAGMEKIITGVERLLKQPRVTPYLLPSRVAGLAIGGCPAREIKINQEILGEELSRVLLAPDFTNVKTLVGQGRFAEAKDLTRLWVFEPLVRLLEETARETEILELEE